LEVSLVHNEWEIPFITLSAIWCHDGGGNFCCNLEVPLFFQWLVDKMEYGIGIAYVDLFCAWGINFLSMVNQVHGVIFVTEDVVFKLKVLILDVQVSMVYTSNQEFSSISSGFVHINVELQEHKE
jgi:hypothetical protein